MSIGIKAKKFIRKIAAITIGAAFLGATVGGALAATYSVAPAADKVAGTKLATGSVTTDKLVKAIGIGAGIMNTSQPEDYFDNPLEDDDLKVLQDTSIQYNDGDGYDDYEIHDELWFGADSPSVETALSTASTDKDYKSDVALEVARGSIYYYYAFDEDINLSAITEEYPVELKFFGKHLQITGVGWSTTPDADRVTVKIGETHYLNIGDEVTVEGHKVKLEDVGDGKVAVSLDSGAIITINEDETHAWPEGLEVEADSVFYKSGDPTQSTANLIIGAEASTTYKDNDEFLGEIENDEYWRWQIADLDGSGALRTTVTAAGTATGPVLALQNQFAVDSPLDDNPVPVTNSGCYDMTVKDPYMQICLDGLTVGEDEYITLDIEPTTVDLDDAGGIFAEVTDANVIAIKSNQADSLKIHIADANADGFGPAWSGLTSGGFYGSEGGQLTSDPETSEIYLALNWTNVTPWTNTQHPAIEVFYRDTDNDVAHAGTLTFATLGAGGSTDPNGTFAYVNWLDTKDEDVVLTMNFCGVGAAATPGWCLNITSNELELPVGGTTWGNDNISIHFGNDTANTTVGIAYANDSGAMTYLGATANLEEASDMWYVNALQNAGIGTQQEDLRTAYGIIIKDPEVNCEDDKVQLLIPGDAVRAKVTIGAFGALGQAIVDEAKLVSEVTTVPAGSILVGGPAANEFSAKAMKKGDYPVYGDALGWTDGWCYIKDLDLNGAAVTVIAGWDAADTEACVDAYIKGTKASDGVLA